MKPHPDKPPISDAPSGAQEREKKEDHSAGLIHQVARPLAETLPRMALRLAEKWESEATNYERRTDDDYTAHAMMLRYCAAQLECVAHIEKVADADDYYAVGSYYQASIMQRSTKCPSGVSVGAVRGNSLEFAKRLAILMNTWAQEFSE